MSLKENDTVKDLVTLFNSGTIKYQDIQNLFGVSRDLIQNRLKSIGLHWDNKQRRMIGELSEHDWSIELSKLFEKQRGNKSPKVRTNDGKNGRTIERLNDEINLATQQTAPTKEVMNVPTLEQTDVIRKRSSFDLDVELMRELKIHSVLSNRNIYEIVETAIRKYLDELKD